jgi:hypothetical protein
VRHQRRRRRGCDVKSAHRRWEDGHGRGGAGVGDDRSPRMGGGEGEGWPAGIHGRWQGSVLARGGRVA